MGIKSEYVHHYPWERGNNINTPHTCPTFVLVGVMCKLAHTS
jgi:hypothetical protein